MKYVIVISMVLALVVLAEIMYQNATHELCWEAQAFHVGMYFALGATVVACIAHVREEKGIVKPQRVTER